MLTLDSMCIRDHVTPDTVFPTLISPLIRPKKNMSTFSQLARTLQSYMTSSKAEDSSGGGGSAAGTGKNPEPLFHLLYEKKPFQKHSVIDHRLHIKSQPLNIVYNPAVVSCLRHFFEIPDYLNRSAPQLTRKFQAAAFQRIEEVKEKTKEELKKNVSDWLLEQDSHGWRKRWDLVLDLSAPQLIIPEHFVDKEATLLILDFGTLHVDNGLSPQNNQKTESAKSPTTLAVGIPAQNRPFPHGEDEEDEDDEGIYVLLQFQCFFYLTVDFFFVKCDKHFFFLSPFMIVRD